MTARIRIEVEGNSTEVRWALEELLGIKAVEEPLIVHVEAEPVTPTIPSEVIDEMVEINKKVRAGEIKPYLPVQEAFCAYCGRELTEKQIESGATYCSPACGGAAASKARAKKVEALKTLKKPEPKKPEPKLSKQVKELTGRVCLVCGKELTREQKKFCSRLHANQYSHSIRKSSPVVRKIKVKGDPNNLTLVAGEGVRKGSA